MKSLFLLLILLNVVGCAQPTIKMDVPEIEKSQSITIKDLRPENEKQSELFSYSISNDAYGIYRKGDETLSPPMVQVFRHRAYEKFGSDKLISEIVVHHMVVYYNGKSAMRSGALFGAIGAAISATDDVAIYKSKIDLNDFESVAKEEYKLALYSEKENPEGASVFVIYIDAELNGKRVFVRVMSPSKAPGGEDPYALAVNAAIKYFLEQY